MTDIQIIEAAFKEAGLEVDVKKRDDGKLSYVIVTTSKEYVSPSGEAKASVACSVSKGMDQHIDVYARNMVRSLLDHIEGAEEVA